MLSKIQINKKKTKKQNSSANLNGGGLFSTKPKIYTNVEYGKSGFKTPILICLQCKNNVFRHHKVVTESRLRAAVLNNNIFAKKINNFVCFKCGFTMVYSGDITYSSSQ